MRWLADQPGVALLAKPLCRAQEKRAVRDFGMPIVSTFASGVVSSNEGDITYMSTTQREIQFGLKLLW